MISMWTVNCLFVLTLLISLYYVNSSIPRYFLQQLQNVTSAEEFIENFMNPDSLPALPPTNETEDALNRTVIAGRIARSVGGDVAQPDLCSVRLQTVPIPQDPDPNIVKWPLCTMIEQCGGCCSVAYYECVPTVKELVEKQVLRGRYLVTGSSRVEWESPVVIYLERHIECEQACKVKENDCNKLQSHDPEFCRCICQVTGAPCRSDQTWNQAQCRCLCSIALDCSLSNTVFSHETCRCEGRILVSGNRAAIEQRLYDLRAVDNVPIFTTADTDFTISSATTPATMTTTPTTTAATTEDPAPHSCPYTWCPSGFSVKPLHDGTCGCKPNF